MSGRRVFLIGIGGSGMEPLAKFALQAGYDLVAGSDPGLSEARYAQLSAQGARVFRQHSPENLNALFAPVGEATSEQQPIVVYSSAIAGNHVERQRALELADAGKIRLMHRMDFLNECFRDRPEALCVAGTHGKTSSSSMAGWLLIQLGVDPHIIVGGRPLYLEQGVRYGSGRTGACETDESDGSFLKARPALRLVLNIDHDHLEHYGDFANLCAAFAQFVAAGRLCVLNAADENLRAIGAESPAAYYYHAAVEGSPEADIPASDAARSYRGRFAPESDLMTVRRPGETEPAGELQLKMPGRHFAANALGVFALVDQAVSQGLLECPEYSPARALQALNEFPGVERRMEFLGEYSGARIYDDYGHHPTEIQAVIAACRVRLGSGRLLAVFQPHRYTRTNALYREFATALADADRVYLLPLYSAGEAPIEGVDTALIAEALAGDRGHAAAVAPRLFAGPNEKEPESSAASRASTIQQAFAAIFDEARPGDLVVCLGAGDISAGIRAYLAATPDDPGTD